MSHGHHITRINRTWYYRRRVPDAVAELTGRAVEKRSLRTTDEAAAIAAARQIDTEVEAYWRDLLAARSAKASERHARIVRLAHTLGVDYQPAPTAVDTHRIEDIERRVAFLMEVTPKGQEPARDVVHAVLGAPEEPTIRVSAIAETFFALSPDRIRAKSDDQIRRWKNPRMKAAREFLQAVGDKPLTSLQRSDLLAYRDSQWSRVEAGEITIATANKQIALLLPMLREIERKHALELPRLDSLKFRGAETNKREPIPRALLSKIVAADALDFLDPELRSFVLVLMGLGARPSEISGLEPDEIRLDAEIPHIKIRPNANRALKNAPSERDMPLVGVAWRALRERPEGFPRYRRSADPTAWLNRKLREQAFLPPPLTLYSARHTFSDLLIETTADERMRCALMGHKYTGEQEYGRGFSLASLRDILMRLPIVGERS